jgi:tetratricopeptide (TPR) repeat protein
MKDSGDKLASQHFYQAALTEYNQLIKHPYLFHDMPMIDKYDLFVTMAKLLKEMGYYSRAEMLLFEAIRYSNEPSDAYYQLSLLSLDKEDLHQAKIYFKNCLYYKENDIVLLVYLSTILLTEGKIYESKFYITRILSHLEVKITQLSLLLNKDPQDLLKKDTHSSSSSAATAAHEHHIFRSNLEDLVIKIYSCEYLLIPSATLETYKFFTTLLDWIQRDEMNGRFLFDLGQSLYERGKATVGLSIMHHGLQTSDIATEGMVSMQVIHLRVALEYPLVPSSLLEILEHYLNITEFLARGSTADRQIDLENIIDLYWPLPLLSWSHLPMAPVLEEFVLSYFHHFPIRSDYLSQLWLTHHLTINTCLPYPSHSMNSHVLSLEEKRREQRFLELEHQYGAPEIMKYRQIDIFKKLPNHRNAMLRDIGFPIELGCPSLPPPPPLPPHAAHHLLLLLSRLLSLASRPPSHSLFPLSSSHTLFSPLSHSSH